MTGPHRPPRGPEKTMSEHNRSVQLPATELTRRRFLQGTTLVGFSAFLAACGTRAAPRTQSPSAGSPAPGASQGGASRPAPVAVGELNFANWPIYIDTDDEDEAKHKTLEDFTAEYGTVVNYEGVINDATSSSAPSDPLSGPARTPAGTSSC